LQLVPLHLEPISFGAPRFNLVPTPRFNLVPTPRFNLVPAARFVTPALLEGEAPLGGLTLGELATHLMADARWRDGETLLWRVSLALLELLAPRLLSTCHTQVMTADDR
jgi:hypothetical protein